MEDLNEMQQPILNEELHTDAGQPVADNDTDTMTSNPSPAETEAPAEANAETPSDSTPAEAPLPATETPAEEHPLPEDNTAENTPGEPADEPLPAVENAPEEATQEESEPEADYSAMNREELLAAFNELLTEDIAKIRNRASAIRNQFNLLNKEVEKAAFEAFLADGGNKDEYQPTNDPLAETFYKAYDQYRARRQKMQEEQEAQRQRNYEAKQQILEELRVLIDNSDENLKQTYDNFNVIQDKWKAVGDVPREHMNDLWQTYHFLIEQFFNKVKINKELRMLDLKRNLEQKIQLCEKAEELIVETSVIKAFKTLQELRRQWKEIGPVPSEQNEETWQRFNNAANQIDERRREYYDQRKEELDQNLLAKQALIEKAAELTAEQPQSTKGWNDTTEALDGLLKLWKSIGPVPHDQNEEIWNRFKTIVDKHYADKKLHFGQIREEQSENYNKKIDLCLRAEAIAKREDWKKATEELLQLQEEWKSVGATSRKVSDKVWHRFRSACDEFFAKKGEYYKDIRKNESENLATKKAIIEELKAYTFGEDKEANLNAIKDFQRRWAETGHVPMKDKERLQKEYRELINGIFEQLKISAREAEETAYREHLRNINPDNKRAMSGERQNLVEHIEKLRADLKLWENNLGFLANSKQADLLKEEFEKKMQNTRQQIALLEAKLRILDEAAKKENPNE